jgi:hypothetical protein
VQFRENTLKLTPRHRTVAPSGWLFPYRMSWGSFRSNPCGQPMSRDSPTCSRMVRASMSDTVGLFAIQFTGSTFQIFAQYSLMERSEENFPIRATFSIDIRDHDSSSRNASATRC